VLSSTCKSFAISFARRSCSWQLTLTGCAGGRSDESLTHSLQTENNYENKLEYSRLTQRRRYYLGEEVMEYLVIGAGPQGCSLRIFLEQTGRDYMMLEPGPALRSAAA
jgi:hypothetical protein